MKRFFQWLKALFNRGMDKLEDPEIMLDQARRDMQEAMVANKEKAVQAISSRNRLQQLMDEQVKKSAMLEQNAAMALKKGDRELAKNFLREKAVADSTIESLKPTYEAAQQSVEQVKLAIKRQEEEVRRKLAESLALKAQWKTAQIQSSITKALEGLSFENEYEGSFAAAREKINNMQAEASARTEMYSGSVAGKVMAMQDAQMDASADEALSALEAKLGLATPAPVSPTVAPASNVDAELDALEQKLNGGATPPAN